MPSCQHLIKSQYPHIKREPYLLKMLIDSNLTK